jgi:acyl-ACP thioesterase
MGTDADADFVENLIARPSVGRVFEGSRRVRLADASAGGRLRLDACARYLQDIANDDARDADTTATAWVARRTIMRVDRFPRYLDVVSLATWCSGLGPRWAERRYSVVGQPASDGEIEAATLWVHVDLETMKPIPVPPGFDEQFGQAAQGRTVRARLHLPTRPVDGTPITRTVWPSRSVDFDVLGHVNNSVYWAMVEEQLARRRDVRAPLTITLEHHDAIDLGTTVLVAIADDEAGFEMWITADDRVVAVVTAARA